MKTKALLVITLSFASVFGVNAASIINMFSGQLLGSNGVTPVSNGGLLQLIASTTDTSFSVPNASSFVGGSADDLVAFAFSVNSATTGQAGSTLQSIPLNYSGSFGAGDSLLLRWWPTLAIGSPNPGFGTPYGEFRTNLVVDSSSSGWVAPADSATIALNFVTAAAGGSQPTSSGTANLVTTPEPTSAALLALGLVSLASRRRRSA